MKKLIHLSGAVIAVLFFIFCVESPLNPFDPEYRGDYRINPGALSTELKAFVPYKVHYRQGKDLYSSIEVFSEPKGYIDSPYFLHKLTSDTMTLYFTGEFEGKAGIVGIRPNKIADTIYYDVNVKSPFKISGADDVLLNDTTSFSLATVQGGTKAAENVRSVIWFVGDEPQDTLNYDVPFRHVFRSGIHGRVSAAWTDWRGNSFSTAQHEVAIHRDRPEITELSPSKEIYSPGDSISFDLTLRSLEDDTASLTLKTDHDTLNQVVIFTERTKQITIEGFTRTVSDTGTFEATAILQNQSGINSRPFTAVYKAATSGPELSLTPGSDTVLVPVGVSHTLYVTGEAEKYVWSVSDDKSDTTEVNQLSKIFFSDSTDDEILLTVYGLDQFGYSGNRVEITLIPTVYLYTTSFSEKPFSAGIYDSLHWEIEPASPVGDMAETDGEYTWVLKDDEGNIIVDTSGSDLLRFSYMFTDSTIAHIQVTFVDDNGFEAAPLQHSIPVRLYRPFITITNNPKSEILEGLELKIAFSAVDSNGTVETVHLNYLDSKEIVVLDSTLQPDETPVVFVPPVAGEGTIQLWAVDDHGLSSDTITHTLLVKKSSPVITSVDLNNDEVYIGQPVRFSAFARSALTGAPVNEYHWDFGDGTTESTEDHRITHTFNEPSETEVTVYCVDSLGIRSEPYIFTVTVDAGIPRVKKIELDGTELFSGKAFTVTVYGEDNPGGSVDSFEVRLTNSEDSDDVLTFAHNQYRISVTVPESGGFTLEARVMDDMEQWSEWFEFEEVLAIEPGNPRVVSVTQIDSIAWMLYDTRFEITAKAPRGKIDSLIVDWADGTEDTLKATGAGSSAVFSLRHSWMTPPEDDHYIITAWAIDDEGEISEPFEFEVNFDEGRPQIRIIETDSTRVFRDSTGLYGDTLLVPYIPRSGSGGHVGQTVIISTEAYDPNGEVVRYFVDFEEPFDTTVTLNQKSTDSVFEVTITKYYTNDAHAPFPPGKAIRTAVFCVDNDGLIAADTFYLEVKARFPSQSIQYPGHNDTIETESFNLEWTRGVDSRLGLDTEYKIILHYNYNSSDRTYSETDSLVTFKLNDVSKTTVGPFSKEITMPDKFKDGIHRVQIEFINRCILGFEHRTIRTFDYKVGDE
ncbi:Polyhydroxyalkanoate synthesis repressor PhaR [Chitinispirillum alkaliphilum]|nr:Polyhydroxyalkanoate synthesis repressor PhaR [Chitinispirillum alkaliphilum]